MESFKQICDINYSNGNPIIDDQIYDTLFGDDNSPNDSVCEDNGKNLIIKLPVWMGSLDKIRTSQQLTHWFKYVQSIPHIIQNPQILISGKLDGISALYTPRATNTCDQTLVTEVDHNTRSAVSINQFDEKLYSRGNGEKGMDLSVYLPELKLNIEDKLTNYIQNNNCYLRGELIMDNNLFKKYAKKYKNPRNLVAGQFGTNSDIMNDIDFIPYEIIYNNLSAQAQRITQIPLIQQFKLFGEKNSKIPWVVMQQSDITIDILEDLFKKFSTTSNYNLDGLVLGLDTEYIRYISGNPKNIIAFKPQTNIASMTTTVEKVVWNISKWGIYYPVIHVKPFNLCGVTIKQVSGFNAKYIKENQIGFGATVVCIRSGDVIPHIIKILTPSLSPVILPSNQWNGVHLQINPNASTSEPRHKISSLDNIVGELSDTRMENVDDIIAIKTLTNLFTKLDVKYVNIKTIEKMYYVCHLHTFFSILNVKPTQLDPHFGPKIQNRIIQQMKQLKAKEIQLEKLIGGSGVLGYGIGAKRVSFLFKELPTILIKKPTINEITQINGISEIIGSKIISNYNMMMKFILLCFKEGLHLQNSFCDMRIFVSQTTIPKTTAAQTQQTISQTTIQHPQTTNHQTNTSQNVINLTPREHICLTGFRDVTLEDRFIIETTLTKKCKYLIYTDGMKESNKFKQAKNKNIPILSRSVFMAKYN